MALRIRDIFFWFVAVVLLSPVLWLNLQHPAGAIQDQWLGPLTNVVCFTLFALLARLYLVPVSARRFGAAVFVFLVLSKFNILTFPPYGDAVGGPLAEAVWLAHHHFDYVGLFHQPGYAVGGPKVYFFSIYPTYAALLYTLLPHIKTFLVVNHLLTFAMAAVLTAALRDIGQEIFRDRLTATFAAILILALPIMQSQSEAINMEIPCLLFSVLCIRALVHKKAGQALGFAFGATLVKGHGLVACGTVCVSALLFFFLDPEWKGRRRLWLYAFLSCVIVAAKVGSKYLLHDQHVSEGLVKLASGWASFRIMTLPWYYAGSVLGFLVLAFFRREKGKEFWQRYGALIICFVAATMWFGLFFNFKAVLPRYKLALAPYLVFAVTGTAFLLPKVERIFSFLLFLAIGVIAWGSFGRYHYRLGANYYVTSERSLEYRNNVVLDQRVARYLEKHYAGWTVGAPFIMAQQLAMPEFGYVQKPLPVMVYGMRLTYGGIKNFKGLEKQDIMKTVWVGVAANEEKMGSISYPMSDKDHVVKKFHVGKNRATLFMGGFAIEFKRRLIEQLLKK